MDFVSSAYAQAASAAIDDPGFFTTHSAFVLAVVGLCVVAVSLFLVLKERPVTTGQSVILGVGLAFLAMPFITNFEWSDKGFKLTMKSAAADLTKEVARLAEDNKKVREELLQLNEALKGTVAKVEEVAPANPGEPLKQPTLGSGKLEWQKLTKPKFFEDFSVRNKSAIELNQDSIGRIQDIEKSLKSPYF
jgi:hypothetical protein